MSPTWPHTRAASSSFETGASCATAARREVTMLLDAVLMALAEIRRNAGRSLLTALGVVIGVAAVIATVTLGDSATAKVKNDVAALGNNMLILAPGNMRR